MDLKKEDIFEDYENHGGLEGIYKPGDELYSENGAKYYPVSRWALDPDEIKPIETTNLNLNIIFKRNNEPICILDFSDILIPEPEDEEETRHQAIMDCAWIAKDIVKLEPGDEEWVNDKLNYTLTENDIKNLYGD